MWMLLLNALPLMMMAGASPGELRTIARGTLSGIERPRQVVVRTEAEWRALWKEHAPEQDPPPVDFSTRTIVAVFLGSRNTAGYTAEIARIERGPREAIVHVRESRPGRDQMLAQVITTPFHIVSVPLLDGSVTFVDDREP
jgi:protease stability complex PrcB-like protein